MVVRMRHTSGHTRNRRSHHALVNPSLVTTEAGTVRLSHHMDPITGMYRGRVVVDMAAKTLKKQQKAESN
jgi:ribosomal protein L32